MKKIIGDKTLVGLAIIACAFLLAVGAWAWRSQVTYVREFKEYLPLLIFDSQETTYPCSALFDGDLNVANNGEKYTEDVQPFLYTHRIIRENYEVYEYWVYCARNDYINYHEHDLERAFVFVKDEQPIIFALSQHNWWNCYQVHSKSDLFAFVERGSHAMAKEQIKVFPCDGLGKRIQPAEFEIDELDTLNDIAAMIFTESGYFKTNEAGDWVKSPFLTEQYETPEIALDDYPELQELLGID